MGSESMRTSVLFLELVCKSKTLLKFKKSIFQKVLNDTQMLLTLFPSLYPPPFLTYLLILLWSHWAPFWPPVFILPGLYFQDFLYAVICARNALFHGLGACPASGLRWNLTSSGQPRQTGVPHHLIHPPHTHTHVHTLILSEHHPVYIFVHCTGHWDK